MKKSLLLLALTLCFTSVVLSQGKNRISVFSGVLHNYMDGSSMMNTRFSHPDAGIFNGVLYNSLGLEYKYYSSNNYWVGGSAQYLEEFNAYYKDTKGKIVSSRSHLTGAFNVGRSKSLSEKLSLDYGTGLLYRYSGDDLIDFTSDITLMIEPEVLHSLGLNLNTQLNYKITNYFQLYTGLNARTYLLGMSSGNAEFLPVTRIVQDGYTLNFSLDLGLSFTF